MKFTKVKDQLPESKFSISKKIEVLFAYLGQGKTIGSNGHKYGLSKDGKLINIHENKNIEVDSMSDLYMIVDSLSDHYIMLMGVEIVSARMKKEKTKSRVKTGILDAKGNEVKEGDLLMFSYVMTTEGWPVFGRKLRVVYKNAAFGVELQEHFIPLCVSTEVVDGKYLFDIVSE